jgi:pyruvate/2-oxoglutarate dehydrogenase complex dihydrolipoamide dehydrogenase (E3) component
VTPLSGAGVDLEPSNAALFYQRVRRKHGMRIEALTDVRAIEHGSATLVDVHTGEERCLEIDTVVLAIGRRSNDALYRALEGQLPVHRIGDCLAPRFLQHAIVDGDAIGRAIE